MDNNGSMSEEVLSNLREIIQSLSIYSKALAKNYGLTSPQLLILHELSHSKEMTIGKLARKISLRQATVTSILDRLEKRGFIQRKRSLADRRKIYLILTEKSNEIIKKKPSIVQEEFKNKFDHLESWEQSLLLSSIQRISSMMKVR